MTVTGIPALRAAPNAASGEIKSLTGLRGVAAFFVMLYHFTVTSLGSGLVSNFVRKGYIWVDLFFVLSGFILALSFARSFADRHTGLWFTYRSFLTRRLARIYPLYILVTVESIIASLLLAQQPVGISSFGAAAAANIAMVQAWGIAPSFEGAAWSVSTEWAAYLIFPCLLWITLSQRQGVAMAAGLLSLAAVVLLPAIPGLRFASESRMGPLDIYSAATPAPLIRCLAEFSLGLLAYRWFRSRTVKSGESDKRGLWSGPVLLLILLAMTIQDADPIIVPLFLLLIATLALEACPLSRLFASVLPVWLGEISYSVYLLHGKFIRAIEWCDEAFKGLGRIGHPASVVLTIVLVCICGTLVHHSIERPCRILLRNALNGRVQPSHQPMTATSLASLGD